MQHGRIEEARKHFAKHCRSFPLSFSQNYIACCLQLSALKLKCLSGILNHQCSMFSHMLTAAKWFLHSRSKHSLCPSYILASMVRHHLTAIQMPEKRFFAAPLPVLSLAMLFYYAAVDSGSCRVQNRNTIQLHFKTCFFSATPSPVQWAECSQPRCKSVSTKLGNPQYLALFFLAHVGPKSWRLPSD